MECICKNNFRYIDSSFVFNTLRLMNEKVDEEVYKLLGNIVRRNNEGIALETINNLPPVVMERLFSVNKSEETISIDSNFIVNYSKIKMLCYLLYNSLLSVDQVEKYREEKKISMTQAYFNVIFSAMQKEHKSFGEMITFLQKNLNTPENKGLDKSIQICISLIKSTKTPEQLEQIFTEYGFGEFRNRTEIIGARMKQLLYLSIQGQQCNIIAEFKKEICEYKEQINIAIINVYVSVLFNLSRGKITSEQLDSDKAKELLRSCWKEDIISNYNDRHNNLYEIVFENYVFHMTRNESYTCWDDYEIRQGDYFILFDRSRLLDYLPHIVEIGIVNAYYPQGYKHYGIYCQNHIIDIVSAIEPKIKKL